jgi:hypothetical protein
MSEEPESTNGKQPPPRITFHVSPSAEALNEAEKLLSAARKNTVSREAAIKFLASTGMYDSEGALIPVEDR